MIVTRGLGRSGGLLATAGLGRIVAIVIVPVQPGGGGGVRRPRAAPQRDTGHAILQANNEFVIAFVMAAVTSGSIEWVH